MVLSEKTLYSLGRRCVYIFNRRKAKKEIPVYICQAGKGHGNSGSQYELKLHTPMGIRADCWKTFSVLRALDASDLAKSFISAEERNGRLIYLMTDRFEKELARHNLTVDVAALHSATRSFEWFLTNRFLYSECLDSYVSMAGFQLARLCTQLHCQPADVFLNDWLCMSKKEILLEQLGSEQYYSSSIYLSHLWVENVAARRIFFVRQIQALGCRSTCAQQSSLRG